MAKQVYSGNPKYGSWSRKRRFDAAVKRVMDEGWTQSETAREYGVSRQHLNIRVKKAREEREARVALAKERVATAIDIQVGVERKRTMSFRDFDERFFGNWICPDCYRHHETPKFHQEISDVIQDPKERRVVINLPPYHSKTTNVTVKDTVYDLCMNPNSRTLIVSKSLPFSRTIMHSIIEILTNEELYDGAAGNLIEEFGPFKGDATWNSERIYVANRQSAEKDATVQALGVQGQIYGRRADKIKFDDIATLDNQRNPDSVLKMLEWIDKEALSRIGKNGKAIWSGTRVFPGDIASVLMRRPGYTVVQYPTILDDAQELTLWPDHFPYEQALIHRSEMKPADFQLVYQNVDIPGLGASFTQEVLDEAKDGSRVLGHYESDWRLVAGLDPAGGNKGSGYTAFTLLGVDLQTGMRYLVDTVSVKSMRAPQMRDQIMEWTDQYPIFEWRVENNGLQSQLVQYNTEIVQYLAKRGVRVTPHNTNNNKWDPQFGVESIAPLLSSGLYSIPWGNSPTVRQVQPLMDELLAFPMGAINDRVMAMWFAELGVRQLMERAHLPLFNERMRVPNRIKKRRRIVDFANREIRRVSPADQRPGHMTAGQWGYRRATLDIAKEHRKVREFPADEPEQPFNIDPRIWNP